MDDKHQEITGQAFENSILILREQLETTNLFVTQKVFPLDIRGLEILTESLSNPKDWSKRFFQIRFGLCIPIVSKWCINFKKLYDLHYAHDNPASYILIPIYNWEYVCVIIAVLCALTLYIADRCTKSKKKRLVETIKKR